MTFSQTTKRIIHDYPAYDIIELEPSRYTHDYPNLNKCGGIKLKAGDKLYNLSTRGKHMIGSVASSALKDGECPYEARDRAERLGHESYFIFGLATCLTAHKRAKEQYIGVEAGQHIFFEGKHFELINTNNQNLGLKEITE